MQGRIQDLPNGRRWRSLQRPPRSWKVSVLFTQKGAKS